MQNVLRNLLTWVTSKNGVQSNEKMHQNKRADLENLKRQCAALAQNVDALGDLLTELHAANTKAQDEVKAATEQVQKAQDEAKEKDRTIARYKKWLRSGALLSVSFMIAVLILCSRATSELAELGKVRTIDAYKCDDENPSYYDRIDVEPEIFVTMSYYDYRTGKYIQLEDRAFLEPNIDYRIDIYAAYTFYSNFRSDIRVKLPAALRSYQSDDACITLVFAEEEMLYRRLELIAGSVAVGINPGLKSEQIKVIINNRDEMRKYLKDAGIQRSVRSDASTLYHNRVSFSVEPPKRSYTYTSMYHYAWTDLIWTWIFCLLAVTALYIICRMLYRQVEKLNSHEDDEEDDFEKIIRYIEEADEGENS